MNASSTENSKKKNNTPAFYMFYKGLMMAFDITEAAFMVYMADLDAQREIGHKTIRPLEAHLSHLGFGRRNFNRCVDKTIRMGLLERVPIDGMYDYIWNMQAYNRLVRIVSSTNSYNALRSFCKRVFDDERRRIESITNDEIQELKATRL